MIEKSDGGKVFFLCDKQQQNKSTPESVLSTLYNTVPLYEVHTLSQPPMENHRDYLLLLYYASIARITMYILKLRILFKTTILKWTSLVTANSIFLFKSIYVCTSNPLIFFLNSLSFDMQQKNRLLKEILVNRFTTLAIHCRLLFITRNSYEISVGGFVSRIIF